MTRDKPAAPGITITVLVAGWSTPVPLNGAQAYFGECQGTVLTADALLGAMGVYRVQAIVPIAVTVGDIVPLALGSAGGLTSMVDISIR